MVLSALLAPFARAEPIGSRLLDVLWAALLAGLLAHLASAAKRGPLLAAAVVAVAAAGGFAGAIAGMAAVGFAATSTRHLRRQAVFARGVSGGLVAVTLLSAGAHGPAWRTAAGTLVAVGLITTSAWRRASPEGHRMARRAALGVVGFAVLAVTAAGIGILKGRHTVDDGIAELRTGLAAARQGDPEGAEGHLVRAEALLAKARTDIDRWGLAARLLPGSAPQVRALSAVLADVEVAAGQAGRTANAADIDALTVQRGRLDLDAVASLENPLRRLVAALTEVVEEVDEQAGSPLLPPLQDKLTELRVESARAAREARLGLEASLVMPAALGAERPQRYLVLFTSPAEARGRFGFPGSFAEVTIDAGRLDLGEHGSTSEVFAGVAGRPEGFDLGDPLLRPYVPFGVTRQFLSVTVPPDFPTVAAAAAELWAQSGRPPVDGVLRFDPRSLAALMQFTGPVSIPDVPVPLTSETVEQFLLIDQYLQFPTDQAPRREVLETVSEVTFERLETSDLPSPRRLVDLFGPLVRTDHLEVTASDPMASAFLQRIGIRGSLDVPTSDSLLVTNINSSGNKIDPFLDRHVRYTATVEGGELQGTVTVELRNSAPAEDLPFYVLGSFTEPPLPLGTNRTTLFVYTAAPAEAIAVNGVPRATRGQLTGGRWLHQVEVDLPPGSIATVTFTLRGPLDAKGYHLDVTPGGGVRPDTYDVEVAIGTGTARLSGPIVEHRRVTP